MGIRVREGTVEAIKTSPRRFALRVERADDVAAALRALRLARVELVGLSGAGRRPPPAFGRDAAPTTYADVSQAVATPGGPLVLVRDLDADAGDLARIPELVADRLADAGVTEALVTSPPLGGSLDALETTPNAVILRLFPRPQGPATTIPADWLDVAVEWVMGDLADDDPVAARILSVEHRIVVRDAAEILHSCGSARAWCDVVNGDLTGAAGGRIRTASLTYGRLPHLALAAGGPAVDVRGLLARFALLQDVGRELAADVAYACLHFEATFDGLAAGLPLDGWRAQGGASPNRVAASVVDQVVPDGYPWQILGPRHAHRLAAGDEAPPGVPLVDGRVEVGIGDPADWLPRAPARADAQEDAIAWLAPLLVDDGELDALLARHPEPGPEPGRLAAAIQGAPPSPPEPGGAPDLQQVSLRGSPSPRRSTRLTPLELAAWFAHEPHTDEPESVSPVLATFVRLWSAGLDDDARQRVKHRVPSLTGTAGDPAADRARRWLAIDWLVRIQAPAWLRAAGLGEAAERLSAFEAITGERAMGEAVDVLGSAITVASRRIEITAAVASGEHDDAAVAWEAWEQSADPSGWVAASETATHGVPGRIAYAADLQVIETSRSSRARDELEASQSTVGHAAWLAALHAYADDLWEQAWRAADTAVRDRTGLTIRIEMGRVAKTSPTSSGDELPEVALEVAEEAAREALMRAAVRAGSSVAEHDRDAEHPWDIARNAARASTGGGPWSVVIDGSRAAVGETAWAEAMDEARAVVDRLLADAPDTVARAVAAAVAREACSAAARGVAYRATAVARAHGADDLGAEQAAREALAGTTAELRSSAYDLLDRLVAVAGP